MLQFNATFIIAMISFVLFIYIMNRIFYKPVLAVMEKRKNFIRENYNDAEASKNEASAIIEDKNKKLDETNIRAKNIVSETVQDANLRSTEIIKNAKNDFKDQVQNLKSEINSRRNSIDLSASSEEISNMIVKKLIGDLS